MAQLTQTAVRSNASGFNDVIVIANNIGTENAKLCRAWVNFNGQGVVAIRANFNVDVVVDENVGRYVINFTNNLAASNSAVLIGCKAPLTTDSVGFGCAMTAIGTTAGSSRIITHNNGGNFADLAVVTSMIFN